MLYQYIGINSAVFYRKFQNLIGSLTVFYLTIRLPLNAIDNLKIVKKHCLKTSCRQLNVKIASCQQLSSFPFSQGNCLVVDNLQFLHYDVDNSSCR